MVETADSRSKPFGVPIPQSLLLKKYCSIPSSICLKAVANVLLLLHMQVVKLIDRDSVGRTRSARRESAWRTWWRTLARTLRWVHVRCIRTERHVWLAGPDLFGSILDGASSSLRECKTS